MNQTEICNLALTRLGEFQGIASIDDQTRNARACKSVYEQCVRTMLRERPWPFAVRQATLSLVGQNQFSDWLYTYRYPVEFINAHRVVPVLLTPTSSPASIYVESDRRPAPQSYPFAIGSDDAGRLIHTNVEDAVALGTVYVDNEGLYDPLFASALAWFIAAELGMVITKNREIGSFAMGMYQTVVSEAFATGMNEPKPDMSREADMIEARL